MLKIELQIIITDTQGLRFDVTQLQAATGATAISGSTAATAAVAGAGAGLATAVCGALKVWPCDFSPKQFGWLINQLGKP